MVGGVIQLFNAKIQKLKQSTTIIFEVLFRRSKCQKSTSLIPIIVEIASRLFGLSTEEYFNIGETGPGEGEELIYPLHW